MIYFLTSLFFLEDSINGDQIHQVENRLLLGTQSVINHEFSIGNYHPTAKAGIGLRNDQTLDSELSHTLNRKTVLNRMQFGDVNETNFFSFIDFKINLNKVVINPSVRLDNFVFSYNNHLDSVYHTLTKSKSIISPKFNILYNPSSKIQAYLKSGFGFHSNDTRTVITDQNASLPKALSTDLGTLLKLNSKLIVNLAVWNLHLQQEFVYVGDAGVLEAKGRTNRYGFDFGIRQQFKKWLFLDVDINYAHARFIDEPSHANYIPLAPNLTSTFGLNVKKRSGFYGGLRSRFMNHRAAIEDKSIMAKGYFITDVNVGFARRHFDYSLAIQNVLNSKWNETQFATTSRLKNEQVDVEEIHFTPGTPFFAKLVLRYSF